MSPCFQYIWRCSAFAKKEIVLAIIGLDNAGKTTTTRSIKGIPSGYVMPTIGFDPIRFNNGQYDVTIYDLGGRQTIRAIWQHYFAEVHGIIFVVDSVATERFPECQVELCQVLTHPHIVGKPVLLLANKQDVSRARSKEELREILQLDGMINWTTCLLRVESCCALLVPGRKLDPKLRNGIQWLFSSIKNRLPELNERIAVDKSQQHTLSGKEEELGQTLPKIDVSPGEYLISRDGSQTLKTLSEPMDTTIEKGSPSKEVTPVLSKPKKPEKLPLPHPKRSLHIQSRQLRSRMSLPHGVCNNGPRSSERSVNSKTPKKQHKNTKQADKIRPGSDVRSKARQMTEVIEIEELDELELNQPQPVCFTMSSPCPGIAGTSPEPDRIRAQKKGPSRGDSRLLFRPTSRREVGQKGKSPDVVRSLYGSTASTPTHITHNENGRLSGDHPPHASSYLNIKGPSPLARIFRPDLNKLHPSKNDLEREQ